MDSCKYLECRQEDGILILSLNRPEKRNSLNSEMYRALTKALTNANDNDDIRVVLLTAKGNYFCAGNDVHSFKTIIDIPYQNRPGYSFMSTLAQFPKPIVAAVPGDAVGIGTTMLLHCDLVFLSQNTRLHLPFVEIGLVPEFASTTLLVQRLGYQRAAELLFLHQTLDAADAISLGLANHISPPSEIVNTAITCCQALAQKPSDAVLHTKRLMKLPQLPAIVGKIEQETIAINELLTRIKLPAI